MLLSAKGGTHSHFWKHEAWLYTLYKYVKKNASCFWNGRLVLKGKDVFVQLPLCISLNPKEPVLQAIPLVAATVSLHADL